MNGWFDRRRARLAASLTLVISAFCVTAVSPMGAHAAGQPGGFLDGSIRYSQVINCSSMIFGTPYLEFGSAAFVGVYTDADESPPVPSVNQSVYMHVVVYGLGNPCSGQYFVPAFTLPSGMALDKTLPIVCFTNKGQMTSLADCPQWSNVSSSGFQSGALGYFSTDAAHAHAWPLPQGYYWDFRIPVKASTVQSGSTLRGFVKMLDGNSSPVLQPTAPVYVFGAGTSSAVLYDSPSTYASPTTPQGQTTPYGILSRATVVTRGVAGYLLLRRTNAAGAYDPDVVKLPVDGSSQSWVLTTAWADPQFDQIKPYTLYKWKVGFDPGALGASGGSATYGTEKSFRSLRSATCFGKRVTAAPQYGQFPTAGDDVIMGTPGVDSIDGGAGNDRICAGEGNDTVRGGSGNDLVSGGDGTDTVSYARTTAGVTVRLATTTAQNTGGAGTDTVLYMENAIGGNGGDHLSGTTGNNKLSGGAGNDALNGGAGVDSCYGGSGTDTGLACEARSGIP